MKNLIILSCLLIGIGMNAFADDKSKRELKGDKHFSVYSFEKAISFYERVNGLTTEGHRRLAQSYQNIEQNIESESAYFELINQSKGVLPEDYLNYSNILKINGKVEESNKAMDKFVELKPDDLRALDYKANKAKYADFSKDQGKYKINVLDFNTDAEDFAPAYYNEQIVFASSRSRGKMIVRNNNWTGNPFYNLYVSDVEDNQFEKPSVFDKGLNGKMHEGPASFAKDGQLMAFTKNNYDVEKKDKEVHLEILFSHLKDGKWSEPVPFIHNDDTYSQGHPSLSSDGNTMYYTSNKTGGFGGSDIYRVKRNEKGEWGNPENLGDNVNTEGDEMFPFFEEKSNTLYFSSNGRFGLGGLDIFLCDIYDSGTGNSVNAGAPLNTTFDDYGVIVNKTITKGYFSSNRTGGSGSDDIYGLDILIIKEKEIERTINGIAMDSEGIEIPSTFITLLDGDENVLDTITTEDNGAYSFNVEKNKEFLLTGEKEKYNDGSVSVNTKGEDTTINADITLLQDIIKEEAKDEEEEVAVTPKPKKGDDLGKILAFDPKTIYFDFDKSNIREDAKKDLDKIIKVMNENPTIKIELASHTDCVGSERYNKHLSNRRAKSSADYIKTEITNPSRVSHKGYGETKPVSDCACRNKVYSDCSKEQHQKNRRTEFTVVSE